MNYYVYILYSEKIDRYYVGMSHDVETRLLYHNLGRKGWTKRGIPWRVVYRILCRDKQHALKLERYIKSQKSRDYIVQLLCGDVTFA